MHSTPIKPPVPPWEQLDQSDTSAPSDPSTTSSPSNPSDPSDPSDNIQPVHRVVTPDDIYYRVVNESLDNDSDSDSETDSAPGRKKVQFDPFATFPQSHFSEYDRQTNPNCNLNAPYLDRIKQFNKRSVHDEIMRPLTYEEEQAVIAARARLPHFREHKNERYINVLEIKRQVGLINNDPKQLPTTFLKELALVEKQIARYLHFNPPKGKQLLAHPKKKSGESNAARVAFEEAKKEWRDAVKRRNEAMAQWDSYVKSIRDKMHALNPQRNPLLSAFSRGESDFPLPNPDPSIPES